MGLPAGKGLLHGSDRIGLIIATDFNIQGGSHGGAERDDADNAPQIRHPSATL